jgi:hypothetical protein
MFLKKVSKPMNLMTDMLPKVTEYLASTDWDDVPAVQDREFTVTPLALNHSNT